MAEVGSELSISTILNQGAGATLCSIDHASADPQVRKIIYNALNNPTHKIADFINKTINVENVLIENVDLVSQETGQITSVPRVVLISPDGESYVATSKGVFTSIRNAYAAFGPAPWAGGLDFEVRQIATSAGSMLSLVMV